MQDPVRFDTQDVASRELNRSQLTTSLVFELQQMAALLQTAWEQEESRVNVRDLSDPQYPMLARSLRSRFDNLQKTIASLKAAA